MSLLEELQTTAGEVATRVGPSTVRIGRDGGRGTGVVIADGIVATNAHNLRGPEVTVTFLDGRTVTGTVRGADGDGDLAVIAVDTAAAPAVTWVDDGPAALGSAVWTVTPAAGGSIRVTFGTVSAVGRPFRGPGGHLIAGSVEHTAPLARGSSGGPLVDAAGRLVGLNTHRLGDGFYLALPADAELRRRLEALETGAAPIRRRLGISLAPAHVAQRLRAAVGLPERDGLLIREVDESGPAAAAGLRKGDLLVDIAGRAIASPDDLFAAIDAVGDEAGVAVTVVRGTEEVTVQVVFEAAADS